ncbi:MAG: rhomboid family intramembrane serine protease [Terriglobia bacterium]
MDSQTPVQTDPMGSIRVPIRRYRPVATYVLLVITIIVFLLTNLAGGSKDTQVLLDFGASYAPYFRQGEYWRLIMPMFLHIGWIHIGLNMYALWICGTLLEQLYGYGRFSVIYIGAGMGGAFLSMEASSNISAGASGAIFGLLGAMLVVAFLHPWAVPRRWRRVFRVGVPLTIVLNYGLALALPLIAKLFPAGTIPRLDDWAHTGGLFTGLLLAGLIPPPRVPAWPGEYSKDRAQALVAIPIVIVAWGMFATARHYRLSRQVTRLLTESAQLSQSSQGAQSLAHLKRAEQIAPRDDRTHKALGMYYLEHRQNADAIREYEEALRLDPQSPLALVQLGLAYQEAGQSEKGQKLVAQGERLAPSDERLPEALGEYYFNHRQYPEAIPQYAKVLRLDRDALPVMLNLAIAYQRTGQDSEARKLFAAVNQKVPQNAADQVAFAAVCTDLKIYDEAIRHYQKAIQLQPNLAVAHNNLAWLLATSDDPKFRNPPEALNQALLAVKLTNAREPNFLDTLAEALYASGKFKEAVDVQKKTLALAPHNHEFQEHMQRYQKAAGA